MSDNQDQCQDIVENEFIEVEKTWDKFASSAKKAGYRDGVTDGRSKVFQKSFDEGYKEGFKNGFAIGKYKGALGNHTDEMCLDKDLEHSRKGWCQICTTKDFRFSSINQTKNKQKEFSNTLLENLYSKYSLKTNVRLHKTLED